MKTLVEGHCTGVSAGYHTISLYVHTCPYGTGSGDVHTGWNGNRNRVIIEEYRTGTNVAAGTSCLRIFDILIFNYKERFAKIQ